MTTTASTEAVAIGRQVMSATVNRGVKRSRSKRRLARVSSGYDRSSVIGRYPSARVRLEPGCTVLLYTDGLIERRGIDLEHSIADLAARAAAHLDTSATLAEVCDQLLRAAPGNDDLALLAVRVHHHP